jgi:hypothetical protein
MIRNELKLKLNLYIDLYKSINETLHNLLDSSKKEISNILVILEKLENEILRIDNNEILENILNYLQKDFIEIDKLYKNPLENKYNRIDNLLINLHKKIEIDLVKLLETSEKDNINNDLYYTLAESIVEEKEIEFIYGGAKKYFDEILENKDKYNLFENDEINIFETYLRKSSDFYYDYLYDLDRFNNLNLSKKTEIIYLFLKDDLPNWIIEETEYSSEDNSSNEDDVRDINSDDISKIDIINQPFEVESLYRMYAREPKELELSPDYQRNFVWKPKFLHIWITNLN